MSDRTGYFCSNLIALFDRNVKFGEYVPYTLKYNIRSGGGLAPVPLVDARPLRFGSAHISRK